MPLGAEALRLPLAEQIAHPPPCIGLAADFGAYLDEICVLHLREPIFDRGIGVNRPVGLDLKRVFARLEVGEGELRERSVQVEDRAQEENRQGKLAEHRSGCLSICCAQKGVFGIQGLTQVTRIEILFLTSVSP